MLDSNIFHYNAKKRHININKSFYLLPYFDFNYFEPLKLTNHYKQMAIYNKSLDDYFRIPILLKSISPLSQKAAQKINNLLSNKQYTLIVDQRYVRNESNPNTDILKNRQSCSQKLYFTFDNLISDWPEYEVIYRTRFMIGIIDQDLEEKQIQEALGKLKLESSVKLIGVLVMGNSIFQNLFGKENIMKVPDMKQQQFTHFIEPWLYNCLSITESQLCNAMAEARRQDQGNKTIVFNRMEEKFDAKIMKRKKKYRCIKLCGDYCLMLQLYKEAYSYYSEAQELLKKIDDYLWILGCLQGKLACLVACSQLNVSNQTQYTEELIAQTYSIAKKVKNWNFQCQNYFKIAKLYLFQPQKFDQLMRTFILNHGRFFHDDQKFILFTTIGQLYQKCNMIRKRNYYYFLGAMIHLSKRSQISSLLLIQIQNTSVIKQWPQLYKKILQQIIAENYNNSLNNQFYLELLSRCVNHLTEKQINSILSELNFSNNSLMVLEHFQFIKLQQFTVVQSAIKPKQNRIGNRESPRKAGGGFFMSWKRDQNFLFQENETVTFRGSISNKIPFPVRLKISFNIHSLTDPSKICAKQQLLLYLQPSVLHKFQSTINLKGQTEQIWVIDKLNLVLWNFATQISLPHPIKYQIYEKQPELDLLIADQLKLEQSSTICIQTQLKSNAVSVPFCLIKFNVSIYYNVDVGFQQNQIVLREEDHFMGIDFGKVGNIHIVESKERESVEVEVVDGILKMGLKKLKVHRKFISRIQFGIQYIRHLNTKYQISKHYVCRCSFYEEFKCLVEQITTPTIQKIYKNSLQNAKIIQNGYKLRLKITKNNVNVSSKVYKFYFEGKQLEMNHITNELIIQKINKKQQPCQQIVQVLLWENVHNKNTTAQIQIKIPFHYLMCKSEKTVQLNINESQINSHKRVIINYQVSSQRKADLSHQVVLNPVEIQIDRSYVMRGKSTVREEGVSLKHSLQILFASKSTNKYQLGLMFNDGWVYWHDALICLP